MTEQGGRGIAGLIGLKLVVVDWRRQAQSELVQTVSDFGRRETTVEIVISSSLLVVNVDISIE